MAKVVNIDDTSSETFKLRKHNLSVSECLHCVVLEEKLHVALEEVKSTKLIIELLKSDSEKYTPLHDRVVKPPSDISGTAHANESVNNKWLTLKSKGRKKSLSTEKCGGKQCISSCCNQSV